MTHADLTGQTFGRLTVLHRMVSRDKIKHVYYLCQCECGEKTPVQAGKLRDGGIKSCGCFRNETAKARAMSLRERKQAEYDFLAEQRRKAQEQQ